MDRRRAIKLLLIPPLLVAGRAFARDIADVTNLKRGEFIWRPEISPRGPVVIVVALPDQLVHVFRNGLAIGASTCSTGTKGHATPTGVFTILQKRKEHYSSTYNNAPMPNMQRLTWRGIALHAGNLPGYPASHGCIRLPMRFSELLFSVTQHGTPVIIADQKSSHSSALEAGLVLQNDAAEGAGAAERKARASSKKAAGTDDVVTSILVSAADRKAYLVSDGLVTFETPIAITDPEKPLGTHLFSLIGPSEDRHSLKWMAFGLGGHPDAGMPADIWSNAELARVEYLDRDAVYRIAGTLRPGTTMVVTDHPAGPATRTRPDLTLITEDRSALGHRRAK
jgi:hypothetical protein